MSLINNDLKTNFAEAREQLFAALRTDNEQEQKQAFENFVTGLEANVSEQVKVAAAEFQEGVQDESILAERGLRRKLTSAERKFFSEAAQKQKITGSHPTRVRGLKYRPPPVAHLTKCRTLHGCVD